MTKSLKALSDLAGRMAATDDPGEQREAWRRFQADLRRIERESVPQVDGQQVDGQRLESVRRLEGTTARN